MPKSPQEKIAALKEELAETQKAAVDMMAHMCLALAKTPKEREEMAQMYQGIADGRNRSRITAVLSRMVAERLRDPAANPPGDQGNAQ